MKNKILSLIVLAAILANSISALAGQTKGPYDDCTSAELKDGTCVKQLYSGSQLGMKINLAAKENLEVRISGGQDCFQQMEVNLPNDDRLRLYDGSQFDQSGMYRFINQARGVCELTLTTK